MSFTFIYNDTIYI